MAELHEWATSRDSAPNTDPPPDGAPENTTIWSDVNNIIREHMAVLARWYQDTFNLNLTGGTAPDYTLTSARTITAYEAGLSFRIEIHATPANGADPVTINLNSIGAVSLYDMHGNAVLGGQVKDGDVLDIVYDGAQFRVIHGPSARFGPQNLWEVESVGASRDLTFADNGKILTNLVGLSKALTIQSDFPEGACVRLITGNGFSVNEGAGVAIDWSDGDTGNKTFSSGEYVELICIGDVLDRQIIGVIY